MRAYFVITAAVIASLLLCTCCALGGTVDTPAPVPVKVENTSHPETAIVKTDTVAPTNASGFPPEPSQNDSTTTTSTTTDTTTTAITTTTPKSTTSQSTTTSKPTDPPKPTDPSTPAPPKPTPTPAPHQAECKFHTLSFIGGTIFAWGLVGIGFVAYKAHQARTEHNYHTL